MIVGVPSHGHQPRRHCFAKLWPCELLAMVGSRLPVRDESRCEVEDDRDLIFHDDRKGMLVEVVVAVVDRHDHSPHLITHQIVQLVNDPLLSKVGHLPAKEWKVHVDLPRSYSYAVIEKDRQSVRSDGVREAQR